MTPLAGLVFRAPVSRSRTIPKFQRRSFLEDEQGGAYPGEHVIRHWKSLGVAQVADHATDGTRLRAPSAYAECVERASQAREVGGPPNHFGNSPVSAQRHSSSRRSLCVSPRRIASAPSRVAFSVAGDTFTSVTLAALARARGLMSEGKLAQKLWSLSASRQAAGKHLLESSAIVSSSPSSSETFGFQPSLDPASAVSGLR